MERILISACLAGDLVRYDAKVVPINGYQVPIWHQQNQLVNVCPEVSGGLKIPRPPAQILNGNGLDVLEKRARVFDIKGNDVTGEFIKGAEYAFSLVTKYDIKVAVLKEKSPSCGVHFIYDGRFNHSLMSGFGVTTALLKKKGVTVFSENELDTAAAFLETL